jgi:hypothetical protein
MCQLHYLDGRIFGLVRSTVPACMVGVAQLVRTPCVMISIHSTTDCRRLNE